MKYDFFKMGAVTHILLGAVKMGAVTHTLLGAAQESQHVVKLGAQHLHAMLLSCYEFL
jgi:hypothetical protein